MIVTVTNVKGGVAKTTTCMGLATAAVRAGHAVRVVDADAQGSATVWAVAAAQAGEGLPFAVEPGNVATVGLLADEDDGDVTIIDCPPQGPVTEAAKAAADFVVVPAGATGLDLQQTWAVADDLDRRGVAYAVLLTMVRRGTSLATDAEDALHDQDVGYFETEIPLREEVKREFGHIWGDDLLGYDRVWDEIEEALR